MVTFGKLKRNKKGSLLDVLFIAFVITFFAIIVLIGTKIGTEINDKFQEMPEINARAKTASQSSINKFETSINTTFLLLALGLSMAVLVLAALVRIHPIFIPFFLIGWIILIFISGIFANVYTAMAESTQLESTASSLGVISFILRVLPFIVLILGGLLMVVMYKTWNIE